MEAAARRAIQDSQESLDVLANRYGINRKTVAKWRSRETVVDSPMGPKQIIAKRLYSYYIVIAH